MEKEPTTHGAAAVAEPDADLCGVVFDDRYRLRERLSASAVGAVYLGEVLGTDRAVAVEVIRPSVRDRALYVERLVRESRTLAQVGHPNIVEILDVGVTEREAVYRVTERLEGQSLAELLRETSPLPWVRVCGIAAQVASALGAAHDEGIIHRDLNPSNVVLLGDDVVKLVDFGLAETKADGRAPTIQSASDVMGTAAYLAPEVARGRKADVRSEVYALGVLLYEMATGTVPFSGGGPLDVLAKAISNPVPAPRTRNPALSDDADRLIRRCLAKRPDLRPATMQVLAQQLQAITPRPEAAAEPVPSTASGAIETTQVTAAPSSASPTAQRGVPLRAARGRVVGEDPTDVLEAAMSQVLEQGLDGEELELESSLARARRQARSKPPLTVVPEPEPEPASDDGPLAPVPQGQTAVAPLPSRPPTLDERFAAELPRDARGFAPALPAGAGLPAEPAASLDDTDSTGRFVLWMLAVPAVAAVGVGVLWLLGVFSSAPRPAPVATSVVEEPTAPAAAQITWDENFRATPALPEPQIWAPDTYTPPAIRRPSPNDPPPAPPAEALDEAPSEPVATEAPKRRRKARRPRPGRPKPAGKPASRPPPPPPSAASKPKKKPRPSNDAEPWKRVPVPSDNW